MLAALILVENVLAVAAQLSLRRGATRLASASLTPAIVLEPLRNPYVLCGLLLHGASFFLYVFLLSRLRVSVLYPVATGLSIALITVFSNFVLGERLGPSQLAGVAAIVGGIALVFAA